MHFNRKSDATETHTARSHLSVAESIGCLLSFRVTMNTKTRRRSFGALCLLAAIAMLVAGETVLKGRLSALGFAAYWLGCFVVTALAIYAALLDARAVREETHAEQRALFENTVRKIQEEKARKAGDAARSKKQPQ